MVYLKGSEVFWENVGGSLTLPLVPLQTFDVDIGDHARVESIRIVNSQVWLNTDRRAKTRNIVIVKGFWCGVFQRGEGGVMTRY